MFFSVSTGDYSAIKLFHGFANQKEFLTAILGLVGKNLLTGYVYCSILTIASFFLIYKTLKMIPGFEDFLETAIGKIVKKPSMLILIAAIVLVSVMLWTGHSYLSWKPISTDEFSYLFQAKLLSNFRVFEKAPADDDFFRTDNIVIKDGKWYSKYTIGFPALIALGLVFHFPWIINPLITILTLFFLYRFAERVFDERVGIASIVIALLSPFFIFNGSAPFQPHISLACAILAASYYYILAIFDRKKIAVPAFAICFTAAFMIRPADCFLWSIVIVAASLVLLVTRRDRKELLGSFALMLILCCAGLSVGLLVNKMQTGDFLKFAFNQYEVKETWGFGVFEHSIYKAVWNIVYTLSRLIAWGMVLFVEFSIISLFNRQWRWRSIILSSVMMVFTAFFFGWYALGHFEYGPRYLFTGFVLMIPVAGAGVVTLLEWLKKRECGTFTAVFSMAAVLTAVSLISVYPGFSPFFRGQVSDNFWQKLYSNVEKINKVTGEKIAVFVANPPDNRVSNGIRNLCPVDDNNIVYLILLEPERSYKFAAERFKDRKKYVAIFDSSKNDFVFEPFEQPSEMNAEKKYQYLIFAGMSYKFSVENPAKAEEFWYEAYSSNPEQPSALMNLANLYSEQKRFDKSIQCWEAIRKINPDIPIVYYSLGRIYEQMQDSSKTMENYNHYLNLDGNSPIADKILDRIKYFKLHGKFPGLGE